MFPPTKVPDTQLLQSQPNPVLVPPANRAEGLNWHVDKRLPCWTVSNKRTWLRCRPELEWQQQQNDALLSLYQTPYTNAISEVSTKNKLSQNMISMVSQGQHFTRTQKAVDSIISKSIWCSVVLLVCVEPPAVVVAPTTAPLLALVVGSKSAVLILVPPLLPKPLCSASH